MNHPSLPFSFDHAVDMLELYRDREGYNPGVGSILNVVQYLPECSLKNCSPEFWSSEDWPGVILPCLALITRGEKDAALHYGLIFRAIEESLNIPPWSSCRKFAEITAELICNKISLASKDVI